MNAHACFTVSLGEVREKKHNISLCQPRKTQLVQGVRSSDPSILKIPLTANSQGPNDSWESARRRFGALGKTHYSLYMFLWMLLPVPLVCFQPSWNSPSNTKEARNKHPTSSVKWWLSLLIVQIWLTGSSWADKPEGCSWQWVCVHTQNRCFCLNPAMQSIF